MGDTRTYAASRAAYRWPRAGTMLLSLIIATVLSASRLAFACGASVGGATGVSACSLAEHTEETRFKFRVGASSSYTSTTIRFSGGVRAYQERIPGLVSFEYRPTRSVSLLLGVGPFFGGHMNVSGVRYDFSPGFVGAVGVSWRVLDPKGARPFILLGAQLSSVVTTTHQVGPAQESGVGYEAFDIRGSAAVGWVIADVLSLYVVGRGFGGPAYWHVNGNAVVGTDLYHYQVGGGLSVTLARRVDLFAEGVPLGERGVSGGVGVSF